MKLDQAQESRLLALGKQLRLRQAEPKALMLAILKARPAEFAGLMRKALGTGSL